LEFELPILGGLRIRDVQREAPSWLSSGTVLIATAFLAACTALPSAGPTATEIIDNENTSGEDPVSGYVIVDIDGRVVSVLNTRPKTSLFSMFRTGKKAPDVRLGVGDSISVTIWEAGAGGLFSTASLDKTTPGSRTATLPVQEIAQDGTIQIPYAGRLKVAGLRPAQVEALIVKELKGKAIEPQAVVTLAKSRSATVTVTGEVTNGMLAPVSVSGDRILDVIATAGGIKAPAYETFVSLTRGETTATVAFNSILADARENVYLRPGDVLTVIKQPQFFTVFGGAGRNELVPFDAAGITLEQALARAGGLLDHRADANGVFLLRFESAAIAGKLRPDRKDQIVTPVLPIVYRLSLRDMNSYFLARSFQVRDKDILYISNAPMTEVQKFLSVIGSVTAPVISGAAVYGAVRR
jgi:polysaccharide export outer membrane protein